MTPHQSWGYFISRQNPLACGPFPALGAKGDAAVRNGHTGNRTYLLQAYADAYRDLAHEALCRAIRSGGVHMNQVEKVWRLVEIRPTAHFQAMRRYRYWAERYAAAARRAWHRKPEVPKALYLHAIHRLDQQLARWRDQGLEVAVEKEPYHRGISHVRAVLRWYGQSTRFFYYRRIGRWRRS